VTSITLARAFDRIVAGEQPEGPLSEFVEAFFQTESDDVRLSLITDTPRPAGQKRLDALAGAIGECMAKHFCLAKVPSWVGEPGRYLDRPWHVLLFNNGRTRPVLSSDEGLREFLTFSSTAEFRSRNIFTDEAPLAPHHYRALAERNSPQ
jgi:hypothetical protein